MLLDELLPFLLVAILDRIYECLTLLQPSITFTVYVHLGGNDLVVFIFGCLELILKALYLFFELRFFLCQNSNIFDFEGDYGILFGS